MKLLRTTAIFAACAVLMSASLAQSAELHQDKAAYWSKGGWRIYSYPEEKMCEAATTTTRGEHFTLAYFPTRKAYSFLVSNQKATSLEDGTEVLLDLTFLRNEKIDSGWGERKFTVQKTEGTVILNSPLLPSPIEEDFARSKTMGLFWTNRKGDPILVAAVSLDGSAEAVSVLRSCALEAAKLNSEDPFLQ